MAKSRTLKIRAFGNPYNPTKSQLHLKGLWLFDFGFLPGDYVSVQCKDGELNIKKISPELTSKS